MSVLIYPVRSGSVQPQQFGADPFGVNDSTFGFEQMMTVITGTRQEVHGIPGDIYKFTTPPTLTGDPLQIYNLTGCRIVVESKVTFANTAAVWIIGGTWEFDASLDGLTALEFHECDNVWIDYAEFVGANGTSPIIDGIGNTDLRLHNCTLKNVTVSWPQILVYSSVKEISGVTRIPDGGASFLEYGGATEVENMPMATMAALRALPVPSSGVTRHVLGYHDANDGVHGIFDWDAADTRADNGGTVIQPDSLPASGRWIRRLTNGRYNVKEFGAKGDDTATDRLAFQACADALKAEGGKRFYIPEGTHLLDQAVVLPSGVIVEGDGVGSLVKAHQTSFVGTNPGGNDSTAMLFKNENYAASALTDKNMVFRDFACDYGAVTIAGGGAHMISLRYVDGVTIERVTGYNGENVTALLACRDTHTYTCRGFDQSNAFFDHWDGSGNCKVIGCVGRSTVDMAQGIQFSGVGNTAGNRTSAECVVAFNSLYGVRNAVSNSATAIITNVVVDGSKTFRFKSFGNYVENADIGLTYSGEGGHHLSQGDTFKDVDQLPVFFQGVGGKAPDDCRIYDMHLIDCDHTVGNVALLSISGDRHQIKRLKLTNTGAVPYGLIAWFTSDANNCVIELDEGAYGSSGAVLNQGTVCSFFGASGNGAWTPTINATTPGDLSVSYSTQYGTWQRHGNLVTLHFHLLTSSFTHTTAGGALYIAGLPFFARNVAGEEIVGSVAYSGYTKANYPHMVPRIFSNEGIIVFRLSGSGQTMSLAAPPDFPSGGTVQLQGTISYFVD